MKKEVMDTYSQLTFENVFAMILYFDEEGKVLHWNSTASSQLGYSNFNKCSIFDIFPRDFQKKGNKLVASSKKIVSTFAYKKNQTCFPVELRTIMEENENGFFGICFATNVTERVSALKEAEKARNEVENANRIRNEFVSNVTHELRTPVNGIKGISSTLYETGLTEEQRRLISIIDRCCDNMSHIINDLLDFSKIQAGKFTLEEREFRFREFLDRTLNANLPLIHEKGLTLRVSVTSQVPDRLVGDELRLTQILNNLLSNAIKFTPAGQISVEVTKSLQGEDGVVELFFMVMDTGIGIHRDDLGKLFKSFSQVDASITRKYGGTGLGLSITKELVELMRGRIFVESDIGHGTTFSFSVRLKALDLEEDQEQKLEAENFIYEGLLKKEIDPLSFAEDAVEEPFDASQTFEFGSKENKAEISKNMERLALCLEMDNWEKAEDLTGVIKKLVGTKEPEVKKSVFQLELAVRKEAKEKSEELYKELEQILKEYFQ